MKAERFTEEQIIASLKEAEAGVKTKKLCWRHGISAAASYGLVPICKPRRLRAAHYARTSRRPNVGTHEAS